MPRLLNHLVVCIALLVSTAMLVITNTTAAAGPVVVIGEPGKSVLPIVIPQDAPEEVVTAANDLADVLGRSLEIDARVASGEADGKAIRLSLATDSNDLGLTPSKVATREQYAIVPGDNGVKLVGNSPLAVQHAVAHLLYRLGYRQYFMSSNWEILPKGTTLQLDLTDVTGDALVSTPDWQSRIFAIGNGLWEYNDEPYDRWKRMNRMAYGFGLRTTHVYGKMVIQNKELFEQNPEWVALVDGERRLDSMSSVKFCISNKGLQQYAIDYAMNEIERRPEIDSVSMEPSDGLHWCECDDCAAMGNISDRVLTLCNVVARALTEKFGPDRYYVCTYAYGAHSLPPTRVRAEPNVVISVATKYIQGGLSVEEIMQGWRDMGVQQFGLRDYSSVYQWDKDLPGGAKASDITRLTNDLPGYYGLGARFYITEAGDNWGAYGLGYYLMTRMLWDIDEAARTDEIIDEFLANCFGEAAEPMREFYELIDRGNSPRLSEDLVGRMYRCINDARQRTDDAAVIARLDDLTLYTRYVEIFRAYSTAPSGERQKGFENVHRYSYEIRERMMVHSKAVWRQLRGQDRSSKVPEEAYWRLPEEENIWKESREYSRADIDEILANGVANNELLDFRPRNFSTELVRAPGLEGTDKPRTEPFEFTFRSGFRMYTWVDDPKKPINFEAQGGRFYQNRGDVKIELHHADAVTDEPVDVASTPPDKQWYPVTLQPKQSGLHWIFMDDDAAATSIRWPASHPITISALEEAPARVQFRYHLGFYVPKGTKVVGGYMRGGGTFQTADRKTTIHDIGTLSGYFSIPVPEGLDGQWWHIRSGKGDILFLTTPSLLAPGPSDALLPAELVAGDGLK